MLARRILWFHILAFAVCIAKNYGNPTPSLPCLSAGRREEEGSLISKNLRSALRCKRAREARRGALYFFAASSTQHTAHIHFCSADSASVLRDWVIGATASARGSLHQISSPVHLCCRRRQFFNFAARIFAEMDNRRLPWICQSTLSERTLQVSSTLIYAHVLLLALIFCDLNCGFVSSIARLSFHRCQ